MYPPLVLFSVTALCTSNTFSNTFLVFEFLGYACFSGACLPEMAEALEPQGIQRDTMGAQMTSCDISLGTGSQEVSGSIPLISTTEKSCNCNGYKAFSFFADTAWDL